MSIWLLRFHDWFAAYPLRVPVLSQVCVRDKVCSYSIVVLSVLLLRRLSGCIHLRVLWH